MKLPRLLFPLAAAVTLSLAPVATVRGAGPDEGWVQDANEKGVVVTTKTEPGRNLPMFRGVSTIDAGIFEILAVLDDSSRFTEWMADCMEARVVKQITELERIEYNRIKAPWPVSDRDTTLRSWITATPSKGDVVARFQAVTAPEQPAVKGVVRMPRLEGFYHLEYVDAGHTKITYQVDADPGGMLPDWLVKLTSRKLPIETLVGLKSQVAKTRGKYETFLKRYDPSHGGKIPPELLK